MWTCGIDIATQQPTLATHNSAISAFGETPRALAPPVVIAAAPASAIGMRRRSVMTSSGMLSAQNTPTPICVVRQPSVAMKCCRSGGHTTPAR